MAAYYYPGWHVSRDRHIRHGRTEWELLYDDVARRAYPDVRRPLAGPIEPSPHSIQDEIARAMAGGIDAFLWCWYWDRARLHLNEAMEKFLSRPIPRGHRYAVLWVNKRPHFRLPIDSARSAAEDRARVVDTDEDDFAALIEHLLRHHWSRPEYIAIDRRPLMLIFSVEPLIRALGAARLKKMLARGDAQARQAGFAGVYYVAVVHRLNERRRWMRRVGLGWLAADVPLAELGFRAATSYIYLPDWDGPPRQQNAALVERRMAEWPRFAERFGVPFWPSVSPGWDARVRGVPMDAPPHAHPWSPVIADETPADFARLLDAWGSFTASLPLQHRPPILPICSWNEWTEGHAVAPCDRHGMAMLEAIAAFKARLRPEHRIAASPTETAAPPPLRADTR